MAIDATSAFGLIRAERVTDTGRACVDIALALYNSGDPEAARAWIKVGFDGDKCHGDAELQRLANARRKKGETRDKAKRAAAIAKAASNVVPMTGRGDAI
jgi:hypothetical protein